MSKLSQLIRLSRLVEEEEVDQIQEPQELEDETAEEIPAEVEADEVAAEEETAEEVVADDMTPEVEEAPEGEVQDVVDPDMVPGEASDYNEYLGRVVVACPICLEPFFAEKDCKVEDGKVECTCPICQEEVGATVQGIVAVWGDVEDKSEDESEDEPEEEEATEAEDSEEDAPEEATEDATEDDVEGTEEVETEDEAADLEEGLFSRRKPEYRHAIGIAKDNKGLFDHEDLRDQVIQSLRGSSDIQTYTGNADDLGKKPFANPTAYTIMFTCTDETLKDIQDRIKSIPLDRVSLNSKATATDLSNSVFLRPKHMSVDNLRAVAAESLKFDESAMNTLLKKFITENYSDVRFMRVRKVSRCNSTLKIESVIKFKSGTTRVAKFYVEGFAPDKRRMTLNARVLGIAKTPAKFVLEMRSSSGNITPVKMSYDYRTRVIKEGRVYNATVRGSHKLEG